MNRDEILSSIDAEIDRLQTARNLITTANSAKRRGRPPASAKPIRKKRVLSAEARAKIAAAQKARWAKAKKPK